MCRLGMSWQCQFRLASTTLLPIQVFRTLLAGCGMIETFMLLVIGGPNALYGELAAHTTMLLWYVSALVYKYKCKKLKSLKQCLTATRPTSHN